MPEAVHMMTFSPAWPGSLRSAEISCSPVMPGRFLSRSARSKAPARARVRACWASAAVSTSWPSLTSSFLTTSSIVRESSTTSTRAMLGLGRVLGHLLSQLPEVERLDDVVVGAGLEGELHVGHHL